MADRTHRRFAIGDAVAILGRTPAALDAQLRGLPVEWTNAHEGENTWSAFDVVAHLIHADRTNWLPRARTILEHGDARPFDDFQRFAHLETSKGRTLASLLDEFAEVRAQSLEALAGLTLTESDLERRGGHPALGSVTLRQLLATWVVHDLDHTMQVSRVLARQYSGEVGPWRAYLRIIRDTPA
jgi:uncharacterized damage-inducible protein DinB